VIKNKEMREKSIKKIDLNRRNGRTGSGVE